MAENDRRSSIDMQSVIRILPLADGTIAQRDRQGVWIYSGILAQSSTPGGGAGTTNYFGNMSNKDAGIAAHGMIETVE